MFSFLFLFLTTSITVRVVSLEVPYENGLWKLLNHRYVKSSFSTIARHNGDSILKENLHLKIFRTCIKIGANSFIKTLVSINENRRGYFEYYYLHKNLSQHFKENHTNIDEISTIFTILFFSQTNLVFKFIPMFILVVLATMYLPFYFLIVNILRILKFVQCLFVFFMWASKILKRIHAFEEDQGFSP